MKLSILISLLSLIPHGTVAWCPTHLPVRQSTQIILQQATADNDYSDDQVSAMESLIVSLSQEPTDEARRERLATIFAERLEEPDFTSLFGDVLTIVGDRTKAEAQIAAEKGDCETEQKQLWALVDMMIQSKVIVKQSSSTFQ